MTTTADAHSRQEGDAPAQSHLDEASETYVLDEQVGFLLRQANQRHLAIFNRLIPDVTPTQFATLAKLFELGPMSQNDLGRRTAMDAATMKGVIDRLARRGLVSTRADPSDQRRLLIEPTAAGYGLFNTVVGGAIEATRETLAPLTPREQAQFVALLGKMIRPVAAPTKASR